MTELTCDERLELLRKADVYEAMAPDAEHHLARYAAELRRYAERCDAELAPCDCARAA